MLYVDNADFGERSRATLGEAWMGNYPPAGSHVKLRKGKRGTIVPVHGNKSLKLGLLRAIERQTGEKIR